MYHALAILAGKTRVLSKHVLLTALKPLTTHGNSVGQTISTLIFLPPLAHTMTCIYWRELVKSLFFFCT